MAAAKHKHTPRPEASCIFCAPSLLPFLSDLQIYKIRAKRIGRMPIYATKIYDITAAVLHMIQVAYRKQGISNPMMVLETQNCK
jgi:hypothetical protein